MRLHRVNLIDSDPKICQALFADKKKKQNKNSYERQSVKLIFIKGDTEYIMYYITGNVTHHHQMLHHDRQYSLCPTSPSTIFL